MQVSVGIQRKFREREMAVLSLIKEKLGDVKVGVFGSYARGDYLSSSDIDFCVIMEEKPNRYVSGELREIADMMGADIVFVRPQYFEESQELFAKNLRRDWRECHE